MVRSTCLQAYVPAPVPPPSAASARTEGVTHRRQGRRPRHSGPESPRDAPSSRPDDGQFRRSRRARLSPSAITQAPPRLSPPIKAPCDAVLIEPDVDRQDFHVPYISERSDKAADLPERCSVYGYNLHMKKLARTKDLRACLRLLTQLRDQGLTPDKYTYSIVLTCCSSTGAVDVALKLYDQMCSEGVLPDDYIQTNLLSAAAHASPPKLDLCRRVFRSTAKPGSVMCNVLMDAYAKAGNVDECIIMYRYMEQRGMPADKYTVSAVVKAFVCVGRLEDAFKELQEMHAAGLPVTSAPFGQIMDAFGKQGRVDRALVVFDTMVLNGIEPTQITYNILIGACAHVSLPDKAFEIFEEMKAASSFEGDRYTLHSLMKCCLKASEGHRAVDLYRLIKRAPFPCNQVSYRLALTGAGQVMDIEAVLDIASDITVHGGALREDTAAVLIAACIRCSDLETALQQFNAYLSRRDPHLIRTSFFDLIRRSLESFEGSGSLSGDFEQTSVVVDELERSWRRGS